MRKFSKTNIRKIARNLLFCLCFLTLLNSGVYAQRDQFLNLSNSRSRALAMGGVFTAVEDDFGAAVNNPGSFNLFEDRTKPRFTVVLNPLLPLVAYKNPEDFYGTNKTAGQSIFGSIQYLIKSVGLSYKSIDLGINLNEERFFTRKSGKFFDTEGFTDNIYHTAIVNIKLSSQVSFGISGSFIKSDENDVREEGAGFTYGVLIKPSNIYQVGITYVDFSNNVVLARKPFERIADESLNAGFAIMPWPDVILGFDVRNLTENDNPDNFGLQEIHLGFEISRISHFAFRGGFYRERNEGDNYSYIYSIGVGLFDLNLFKSKENRFSHKTPILSYSLLLENAPTDNYRWHMLTMKIRL